MLTRAALAVVQCQASQRLLWALQHSHAEWGWGIAVDTLALLGSP